MVARAAGLDTYWIIARYCDFLYGRVLCQLCLSGTYERRELVLRSAADLGLWTTGTFVGEPRNRRLAGQIDACLDRVDPFPFVGVTAVCQDAQRLIRSVNHKMMCEMQKVLCVSHNSWHDSDVDQAVCVFNNQKGGANDYWETGAAG